MWDKFGEFDSAEELNKAAEGLKEEGDKDSLISLAKENGIDVEDVNDYMDGSIPNLATDLTAALGKLEIESTDLSLPDNILIHDWVNQIKTYAMKDEELCRAIKRKGKSLAGCLGKILTEAFQNQWDVPAPIKKAAGVSQRVTLGIPSAAGVNLLIRTYYSEEAEDVKE